MSRFISYQYFYNGVDYKSECLQGSINKQNYTFVPIFLMDTEHMLAHVIMRQHQTVIHQAG
ncbi:hypothetical protein HZS38_02105 [Xenorhabdus nematophila]|uniref:Uncharacterized protein n=1 Tax=Xenorhabdus nematophila (strain ATCC 19061 / DSM 3370 / CCUG 14189 / LMG 1036 / NCIMB 9965 / AN6) TaxID=406817 RepID=D3VLP3_XENNA|nr:hypothetical protein [Xenorhabdus nematophila]AYA39477.1 hypothetical protein D3790_02440 [Xenorhabdus nematophila]KHD28459.1 hypothetical protein LH67_10690 [Xenorhabdus nematophila]MBA0018044.1 hypothetical protein [Xenorhabdus nematophila]MCB4424548.1 hypothetical protein [Xenorhabdus nematophila]QNJ37126.1 hypothetical protein H8F46_02400 [Xenorhabdus nematophila]